MTNANETINNLKANLKTLKDLHKRLNFVLNEIEQHAAQGRPDERAKRCYKQAGELLDNVVELASGKRPKN
jgi:hypothetical protein